jgi:mono/diheme cytochrome c family protein
MMTSKLIMSAMLMTGLAAFSANMQRPDQGDLKAAIARGSKVYETYCLSCHQADGSGVPGMNPPLKKTKWVEGPKKALAEILLKGLTGEIEVDGDYYDNVMPSQAYLKDEELADVMTYVRNSFGNKASGVSASEVKKWRAAVK